MKFCSVTDVQTEVYSETVTDFDIDYLITSKTEELSELTGCTDISNSTMKQACKFGVCAAVCRLMKFKGELPASVKQGNFQQQNTIDIEIAKYEAKEQLFISRYNNSSYEIPSGMMGYTQGVN